MENQEFITDINPLDEPVNEKRYTQANVDTSGIDFSKPIDEPSFQPPPFKKNPNVGSSTSTFVDEKKEKREREPINPEMKNLSKKDTKSASRAAANMFLQGYVWLHELGNKYLQISEKKLEKLQESGQINLDAVIQYDYGTSIRAGDFFKEYNRQVSNILQVSDEFKEEVLPLLEDVLQERGIGVTKLQQLGFVIGKDVAGKFAIILQQKQQMNHMMKVIAEATQAQAAPPPPPTPPPAPAPAPKETVIVEPEEYMVDKEERGVSVQEKPKRGRPRKYNV